MTSFKVEDHDIINIGVGDIINVEKQNESLICEIVEFVQDEDDLTIYPIGKVLLVLQRPQKKAASKFTIGDDIIIEHADIRGKLSFAEESKH